MATLDVHQHLWPAAFQAALRARRTPPRLDGDALETPEGRSPFDPAAHEPEARLALLDRDGIDVAVLSLQPTLGIEALPGPEREELELGWADAVRELVAGSGGRFRALAPWRVLDGFAGTSAGASILLDPDCAPDLLDELDGSGGVLFVHPESAGPTSPGRPDWWGWTVGYTGQMQQAYLAWLAGGSAARPGLRVVFSILAGGAPIQLERLAHRGVDARAALVANVFFDTATYGRRALELAIETYGVERLVYGSDTPVVDSGPTLTAVRGFGDSVARILQIDTPEALFS